MHVSLLGVRSRPAQEVVNEQVDQYGSTGQGHEPPIVTLSEFSIEPLVNAKHATEDPIETRGG